MPFKRFVQTGRVASISGGRYSGRLCTIVDVIDQTRALVDGPETGVPRIPIRLNQLRLTKHLVKFPFQGSTRVVRKAWKSSTVVEKWKEGQWSNNLRNRRKRRHLSDYERFKLRHAKKVRNHIRTVEFNKLLKQDNKNREKLKRENKGKKGYNRRVRKPKKVPPKPAKSATGKPEAAKAKK